MRKLSHHKKYVRITYKTYIIYQNILKRLKHLGFRLKNISILALRSKEKYILPELKASNFQNIAKYLLLSCKNMFK